MKLYFHLTPWFRQGGVSIAKVDRDVDEAGAEETAQSA